MSASATFNGVALMPTSDSTKTFQVGEGTSDTTSITFETVDILALFGADGTDLGGATNTDAVEVETGDHSAGGLSAGSAEARGEIEFEVANSVVQAVHTDFNTFATKVDTAIGTLNGFMNQVGIDQRSLSNKEVNLTEAITANSAARSRIMDTDFAKEQSNSIRLQILQQTATAALSQANMGPQAVLGFLG